MVDLDKARLVEVKTNVKQYYVEFCCRDQSEAYAMQSKCFDTEEEAMDWYYTAFDYIDSCMRVYLMVVIYGDDGNYEVEQVREI